MPWLANPMLGSKLVRALVEKLVGIAADAPLPPFERQRFDRWFSRRTAPGKDGRRRVLLWDEDDSIFSMLAGGASSSSENDNDIDLVPVGPEGLAMMERGEASALIHIPAGFTDDFLEGRAVDLEVVNVTVTVRDEAGALVGDLQAEDFVVKEDGREQALQVFAPAADPAERYSAVDTIREQGNVYLTTGSKLRSSENRVMLEIVADTCGRHDTLGGACATESNTSPKGFASKRGTGCMAGC